MTDKSQIPGFQAYQLTFTQHIRHPKLNARPANVPAKRMAIYTEIVYNNIEGIVAACFPVAKSLLSAKKWQQLVRSFMSEYRASTPIFREISQQFLHHLKEKEVQQKLPPFMLSLMHYEWVELALSVVDVPAFEPAPLNILHENITLNPALYLLQYAYPVHQISVNFQPKKASSTPTYLLVFRNNQYQIEFIELNAMTYQLVAILQNVFLTGEQALQKLAADNPHIAPEIVLQYGAQTLAELKEKGVIVGAKKAQ